jgi:circadian clock protein KaiC
MSNAIPEPQARLGSGIAGLDTVLGGGWPAGGSYLVQGDAGAGKTTVALHFLMRGAAVGERCAFVSLSESEAELRQNARTHG